VRKLTGETLYPIVHIEADDIEVTGDCPESEQLPSQG
jgi:hypothetical protein